MTAPTPSSAVPPLDPDSPQGRHVADVIEEVLATEDLRLRALGEPGLDFDTHRINPAGAA